MDEFSRAEATPHHDHVVGCETAVAHASTRQRAVNGDEVEGGDAVINYKAIFKGAALQCYDDALPE